VPPHWPAAMIAVGLGGAIGANVRFLVSLYAARRFPDYAPLGTLIVNVVGCLLIGGLVTWADRTSLSPVWKVFLVTGCLGSLTTFSTFGYETLAYVIDGGRWGMAAANVALNVAIGLAAVIAGRQLVMWWLPG